MTCLTDEAIAQICDCVKDSDLFSACHQGPLRTTYSRAQTFKKMFKYLEPNKVKLGNNENMGRFAYYVPVTQTVNNWLESDIWKNSVSQQSSETHPDEFCDISDSQNFKSNQFFIENPGCLKLILYQEAFEIVNPLGSAKKKTKFLQSIFLWQICLYLGSHSIGGFTENFRHSEYFCRYCEITKSEFQNDDPNVCGPQHTPERYDSAVQAEDVKAAKA